MRGKVEQKESFDGGRSFLRLLRPILEPAFNLDAARWPFAKNCLTCCTSRGQRARPDSTGMVIAVSRSKRVHPPCFRGHKELFQIVYKQNIHNIQHTKHNCELQTGVKFYGSEVMTGSRCSKTAVADKLIANFAFVSRCLGHASPLLSRNILIHHKKCENVKSLVLFK